MNLNHPNIHYKGILFPIITPNSVTFNRLIPLSFATPSSGIFYPPCNLTRATQSGVSIHFKTSSPTIQLAFEKQQNPTGYFYDENAIAPFEGFTVSVNGKVIQTISSLTFIIENPSKIATEFEINLPISFSVILTKLEIEKNHTLEKIIESKKDDFAVLGTSISMGTCQYNSTQTYPYQVAELNNWNLYNFAVAGACLGWELAYNLESQNFDVILIEQGFNDWVYLETPLNEELDLYQKFIEKIREFQPNAQIFCLAPLATTYQHLTERYSLDDFRKGIENIVQKMNDDNFFYINTSLISDGSMMADGIHLSIEGAAKFAKNLAPLLK